MSIIQPWLPGAVVVDLFAGSGALGLEALSRGAERADFVDSSPVSIRSIGDNARTLGAGDRAVFHKGDAVRFAERLAPQAYDVAFADPPYESGLAQRVAEIWLATPFAAIFGVEHGAHERMPAGGETRTYGATGITLFRATDTSRDTVPSSDARTLPDE